MRSVHAACRSVVPLGALLTVSLASALDAQAADPPVERIDYLTFAQGAFPVRMVGSGLAVAAAQEFTGIEQVAWLEGCWEAGAADRSVEEQWMAPRGGSMIGMSRTVRAGSLAGYELVVIREDGDRLAYQAHPSGQAAAVFTSRIVTADSVVFENPEHDYPQRIGYRRAGEDGLTAWIEGMRAGEVRRGEFPYRRVSCAGAGTAP